MSDIHRSAADGYAASAAKYVQGRPDYPAEVDDWLRSDLALGPGKVVLDLGAGTGRFVPHLLRTGASVVAIEPVAAMLAQLIQLNPGVDAKQGSAGRYSARRRLGRCRRVCAVVPLVRPQGGARGNRSGAEAWRRPRAHLERSRRADGVGCRAAAHIRRSCRRRPSVSHASLATGVSRRRFRPDQGTTSRARPHGLTPARHPGPGVVYELHCRALRSGATAYRRTSVGTDLYDVRARRQDRSDDALRDGDLQLAEGWLRWRLSARDAAVVKGEKALSPRAEFCRRRQAPVTSHILLIEPIDPPRPQNGARIAMPGCGSFRAGRSPNLGGAWRDGRDRTTGGRYQQRDQRAHRQRGDDDSAER